MKNQDAKNKDLNNLPVQEKELDPRDLEKLAAGHNDGSTHTGF